MLEHSRGLLAVVLIVVALAGTLWLAKFSNSYQQCDAAHKQNTAHYESANSQKERARRFIVCEGAFLDTNKEVVTALATLAIAAFTLTLWLATGRQSEITRRLADLAEQEFIATHRPHIRVRHVESFTAPGEEGNPIGAEIHFTNIGAGRARIATIEARIFQAGAITLGNLVGAAATAINRELVGGQPDTHRIISGITDLQLHREGHASIVRGTTFLLGRIRYMDGIGTTRETVFCWHLLAPSLRWICENHPEMNYED